MSDHPQSEELADYLYDELPAEKRASIAQHLEACADCRADLKAWRGAQQALRSWKLPKRSEPIAPASFRLPGPLRWAAAAMLMIGIGYGVGRFSQPQPDLSALRTELAQQVRGELRAELVRFAADQSLQQRQEYQRALLQAANQLDARRLADYATLRRDVETVAFRTQQGFDSLAAMEPSKTTPAVYESVPNQ